MSLKYLSEISSVVTNYTKKSPFEAAKSGSKAGMLLQGILKKTWQTEDHAELQLYGKLLEGRSFDMLKSRAKEQLINSIFLIDTQKRFKSSYDKAYYNACKKLAAGLILINRNAAKSGIALLKDALLISEKHHFTDISVMSLRLLRYLEPYFGKTSQFERLNNKLLVKTQALQAELRVEELNQRLLFDYLLSYASKTKTSEMAHSYYKECLQVFSKYDTHSIRLNTYRIGIRYFDSIGNYKKVIELASECISYLESNPHLKQLNRLGEMSLHKLNSCLNLRNYPDGNKFAEESYAFFPKDSINWLYVLELHFLLAIQTNNIIKANELITEISNRKGLNKYPQATLEKWKIFEAFLHYALPETRENKKRFNTARFINEVPIFSKDKAGYNLSIIIAQVILLIKAGEFEKVVEKAEALKLYASRYIKKEKSPRSYYFIKMLLVMIKYDFEPSKTEEIAEKFFVKLKATHMGEQNQLETLEVIPYDLLWPRLLEQLRKK